MDAVKAGWFSEEEILWMLDIPDLGPATAQKLAEFGYAEKLADGLLEDTEPYETPDEWMDPAKLFDYCRKRYLRAVTAGNYPKGGVYKMRKLLDYLKPLANPAPPAPAAIAAPALPGLTQTPEAAIAMPAGPTQ